MGGVKPQVREVGDTGIESVFLVTADTGLTSTNYAPDLGGHPTHGGDYWGSLSGTVEPVNPRQPTTRSTE